VVGRRAYDLIERIGERKPGDRYACYLMTRR